MIKKRKLNKLKHFLQYSIHPNELKNSVEKYPNSIYKIVLETLNQLKYKNYSSEDQLVFDSLKNYRDYLSQNIDLVDFKIFNSSVVREVRDQYYRAASPETWCKFHYLMAKNFNAKNYLEIGTNLGVSGSYILSAVKRHKDGKFVTMEGAPKLCEIAEKQFHTLASSNQFQIIQGLYQNTMPEMYNMPIQFDMAFIDGNHKYDPTLEYFLEIKKKIGEKTILIFDDIYNTDEMKRVWDKIIQDPEVNFSIDLYKLGIVILDKTEKIKGIHTQYFLTR